MTQNEKKKSESRFDFLAKIPNGIVVSIVFLLLLSIASILAFFGHFSIGKLCIFGFWVGGLLRYLDTTT